MELHWDLRISLYTLDWADILVLGTEGCVSRSVNELVVLVSLYMGSGLTQEISVTLSYDVRTPHSIHKYQGKKLQ